MKKKVVVITIFNDPELYPPTLYGINELAKQFETVIVIARHFVKSTWQYPLNVQVIYSHKQILLSDSMLWSYYKKIYAFLKFTWIIKKKLKKEKPLLVLAYDELAVMASWLALAGSRRNCFFWYHNHDVIEQNRIKRYSLQWVALRLQQFYFKALDLFTLPSIERKQFFPMNQLKGKFQLIPNYPLKELFVTYQKSNSKLNGNKLKLFYHGKIASGHGFEEIINILSTPINDFKLELTLVGSVSDTYKHKLIELAKKKEVDDQLIFYPAVPFEMLHKISAKYDIGLGIKKELNVNYSTNATSSNKIYEYAAVGLPVLIFESPHFREYLAKYNWAVFTNLTEKSLTQALQLIVKSYEELSTSAYNRFLDELHFQNFFPNNVIGFLNEKQADK